MDKQIIGMGIEHFPFKNGQVSSYLSSDRKSLMDGDVILFSPQFFNYTFQQTFEGKPLLTEDQSRVFRDEIKHWESEFQQAMSEQKTIFVFCEKPPEFYYYKTASSRYGNQYEYFNPFLNFLPLGKPRIVSGKEIKKYSNTKATLKSLWDDFEKYFYYEIAFSHFRGDVYFVPKNFDPKRRSEVFGGIIKTPSGGFLVILPAINFRHSDLVEYTYNEKAYQLSNRLIQHIIQIDQTLKSSCALTPPPDWSSHDKFKIDGVSQIKQNIGKIDIKIEKLGQDKADLEKDLEKAKMPYRLLFETGKPLEEAVINCLELMGFKAQNYRDAESEFDVTFKSKEGTGLGEVEGKNKDVNRKKISQLITNLVEYNGKDNTEDIAKGVLFGNAYRLDQPSKRSNQFTEKCIQTANQHSIALVCTSDLFYISQHLQEHPSDKIFATKCREAILSSNGIVSFDSILKPVNHQIQKETKVQLIANGLQKDKTSHLMNEANQTVGV